MGQAWAKTMSEYRWLSGDFMLEADICCILRQFAAIYTLYNEEPDLIYDCSLFLDFSRKMYTGNYKEV